MSFILIAESESPRSDRVRDALVAGGWEVRRVGDRASAVELASREVPDLVLVSADIGEARRMLSDFSWLQGGPGSVLLLDEDQDDGGNREVADDTLSEPFDDEGLREFIRRCLVRAPQRGAAEEGLDELMGGSLDEFQLTSDDLFSDLVDEVEGDAGEAEESPAAPVSVVDGLDPSMTQPLKVVSKKSPARAPAGDDQEDALEKTLSGFLAASVPKPKKKKMEDTASGSVDALLSRTLSGLELPAKPKRIDDGASTAATQRMDASKIQEMLAAEAAKTAEPLAEVEAAGDLEAADEAIEVAESEPEIEAAPELELELEPEPEPEPEPEIEAGPELEEEPEAEPEPETEPREDLEDVGEEEPATEAEPEEAAAVAEEVAATEPTEVPEPAGESPAAASSRVEKRAEPAPRDGREFGQYTLLDRIALGGMAEVWRARMKGVEGFQKTVAIKKILPHLTDSSDFVTMFIDEAKLAAQLNHSNIIHIYDLGKIENDYYIAMEFVDGKDLRTILNYARRESQPLPMGLALMIAAGLASGLDHAHHRRDFENRELGLVHRDVSPQNVLISYSGDIKLCDFGIVKAVAKASKTQMGALKGKLQYMSPEQAWGRTVDARSDIFSLGAVLFEMLTGRRLFSGESEISVLEAVRECRIQSPREIDERISVEVNLLALKALEKDPDDRFQTAGEMHEELKKILFSLQTTPSQADLGRYMQRLFQVEPTEVATDEAPVVPAVEEKAAPPAAVKVEAVAPKSGVLVEEAEGKSKKGLMLAIAAAALIGIALIVWALVGGDKEPQGVAETAPPIEAPAPQPPEPVSTTEPADDAMGEDPGSAAPEEASAASDSEPTSAVKPTPAQPAPREEQKPQASPPPAPGKEPEPAAEPPAAAASRDPEPEPEATPTPVAEEPDEKPFESVVAGGEGEAKSETAPPDPAEASAEEKATAPEPEPEVQEEVAEQPAEQQPPPPPPLAPVEQKPPPPVEKPVQRGDLVELGPGVVQPKRIRFDKPRYPPQAKRAGVQGTVILRVLVDDKGRVEDVQLLRGVDPEESGINAAAIKAAKSARYEAATKNGVAVKMWITQTLPFRL